MDLEADMSPACLCACTGQSNEQDDLSFRDNFIGELGYDTCMIVYAIFFKIMRAKAFGSDSTWKGAPRLASVSKIIKIVRLNRTVMLESRRVAIEQSSGDNRTSLSNTIIMRLRW